MQRGRDRVPPPPCRSGQYRAAAAASVGQAATRSGLPSPAAEPTLAGAVTSSRCTTFSVVTSCAVRSPRAITAMAMPPANTSQLSAFPLNTRAAIRDHSPTRPRSAYTPLRPILLAAAPLAKARRVSPVKTPKPIQPVTGAEKAIATTARNAPTITMTFPIANLALSLMKSTSLAPGQGARQFRRRVDSDGRAIACSAPPREQPRDRRRFPDRLVGLSAPFLKAIRANAEAASGMPGEGVSCVTPPGGLAGFARPQGSARRRACPRLAWCEGAAAAARRGAVRRPAARWPHCGGEQQIPERR